MYWATFLMATELCRFEYRFLDNDGNTTLLENWVKKGTDIFSGWNEKVGREPQHLVPPGFAENPLASFDFC